MERVLHKKGAVKNIIQKSCANEQQMFDSNKTLVLHAHAQLKLEQLPYFQKNNELLLWRYTF